jgi:hypothetical protein
MEPERWWEKWNIVWRWRCKWLETEALWTWHDISFGAGVLLGWPLVIDLNLGWLSVHLVVGAEEG